MASTPLSDKPDVSMELVRDPSVRRPGALSAICVIAMLLGALGLLSGLSKLFNSLFGAQMQRLASSFVPAGDAQQMQERMNAAVLQEMQAFLIPNVVLSLLQLVLCGLLIYAAARLMQLREPARKLLAITVGLLVAFELASGLTQGFMQIRLIPVMETHMSEMMRATPGSAPGAAAMGRSIAKLSILGGLLFQGLWTLLKVGFFAFTFHYLRRPSTRRLCLDSTPVAAELA